MYIDSLVATYLVEVRNYGIDNFSIGLIHDALQRFANQFVSYGGDIEACYDRKDIIQNGHLGKPNDADTSQYGQ
jgi:hypothetical protein